MPKLKTNAAAEITASIIARLKAGVRPWVKPWTGGTPGRPLRATGEPYRGINIFWLWLTAERKAYRARHWMTYRQAAELGGQVRKGERASTAIFYKAYKRQADDADDSHETETRRVMRSYNVFNADQIDGLPERFLPPPVAAGAPASGPPPRS